MAKLNEELKRRNVFRIAALSLVAGWLVLQVAEVLAGVLGLPDWTLRFVAFLLLLGFPLALVFSWVYELTPEGIKRESEIDRSESATGHTSRKLGVATVAWLAAAVTLLALDRFVGVPDVALELIGTVLKMEARPTRVMLEVEPAFTELKKDPRFAELLDRYYND